jgi:enoyl-CoA hydratase/carnithine racemase
MARIATEKSGHIFLIVIDRPKKLNGFSVKIAFGELGRAFSAMEDDSDIRCGVLCAEGRNFTRRARTRDLELPLQFACGINQSQSSLVLIDRAKSPARERQQNGMLSAFLTRGYGENERR